MTDLDDTTTGHDVTRRVVLRSATVGGLALPLLVACGGSGDADDGSAAGSSDSAASGDAPSDAASSDTAPSGGSGGGGDVSASDVPVGGGTVLEDQKVVVTQPASGDFKAFTAVCTHQGCLVTKVEDGEIVCPCHGSRFAIEDGSPLSGPAQSPLAAKKVTVDGDSISVS
jgi:Rieske Fe-S protein